MEKVMKVKQKYVGIDLGSSNLIVYQPNKGIIFNEPNIVSYHVTTKKAVAIGYMALKMLGKEPENVEVCRPVKDGVIASIGMQTLLLKQVLKEKHCKKLLKGANLVVSVPSQMSEVNVRSVKKLAKDFDVRSVDLQAQSYLTLLGMDSSITGSQGNLVVTLGGGCSDITVASGTRLLISRTCSFSGRKLDEAITRHLRKKHHLIIGDKTSEYIKMKIGSLEQFPENRLLEVSGRDLITGLPNSVVISTIEIKQAILPCLSPLVDMITDCLEMTPPEVSADIIESGIVIAGGGSLLGGIREYLESNLNVAVRVASDSAYAVVNGIRNYIHLRIGAKKEK